MATTAFIELMCTMALPPVAFMVRGSERLITRLSELAGPVLAAKMDYLTNSLSFLPLFLVGSGIRTHVQEAPSLLRVAPRATIGA